MPEEVIRAVNLYCRGNRISYKEKFNVSTGNSHNVHICRMGIFLHLYFSKKNIYNEHEQFNKRSFYGYRKRKV